MHGIKLFTERNLGSSSEIFCGYDLSLVPPSGAVEWIRCCFVYFGEGVRFTRLEANFDKGLGVGWLLRVETLFQVDFGR